MSDQTPRLTVQSGHDTAPAQTKLDEDRASLGSVASALWAQREGRRVATELGGAGIKAVILKGPELQQRLYGTPAMYASGDIDVLVPRSAARRARQVLVAHGWTFEEGNGLLWRLSEAAAFQRTGFHLDLHWGIHAAHLPGFALRPLEQAIRAGARPAPSGFLEPDPESLVVFLAVHVVGHAFERPEWSENVLAADRLVRDEAKMWRIARASRVESALVAAREGRPPGTRIPLPDGLLGRLLWAGTWVTRGHFVPSSARRAIGDLSSRLFKSLGKRYRTKSVSFRGLHLEVPSEVFVPTRSSERLVDLVRARPVGPAPLIVDVGSGSGAIALALSQELTGATVYGTDTSTRAIRAAEANARRLGLTEARFLHGSLLNPMPWDLVGSVDVVVSNVPFVSPATASSKGVRDAPPSAVIGPGADGLDLVRSLVVQAARVLSPGGSLVLQLTHWQWGTIRSTLDDHGFTEPELFPMSHGPAVLGVTEWSER